MGGMEGGLEGGGGILKDLFKVVGVVLIYQDL